LVDLSYAVVKASARKGGLLSYQQLVELASSRDLKDFVNRVKERYPALALSATPTERELEDLLLKSFTDEVDEFIEACPDASAFLQLIKREVEEVEAAELMKQYLESLGSEGQEGTPKKQSMEGVPHELSARGFDQEVKEARRIFEKYKVPGLVDSVFARYRIIKMLQAAKRFRVTGKIRGYLKLKVDVFNVATVLRGIRNGIDRKALEEVLIFDGGSLSKDSLKNVLKAADEEKALKLLVEAGLPRVENARALERAHELKIAKILTRMYYSNYISLGAIVGYLELKLREVRDLVRIANAVSRGLEPRRIAQDFIF
jgi:vacuolar-type H+-ATPase subunit C/Vma6